MVRIEKNKLIIEMETSHPAELYNDLLKDILVCVQATQADQDNDKLRDSMHYLLELYKAMLPNEEQVERMFSRK